jgi:hypothetical protein
MNPFITQFSSSLAAKNPPLTVAAGALVQTEIRLPAPASGTPVFKVNGHVNGAPLPPRAGGPPFTSGEMNGMLKLVPADLGCNANMSNPQASLIGGITSDGVFKVRNAPAGTYRIRFGNRESRSPNVTVTDRDIVGLLLDRNARFGLTDTLSDAYTCAVSFPELSASSETS